MNVSAVVVVDRKKARLFTTEIVEDQYSRPMRMLVEKKSFANIRWEALREAQKIDTRRGDYPSAGPRSTAGVNGSQSSNNGFAARSSFSDAEMAEDAEVMRLFARDLGVEMENFIKENAATELVIAAGPKVLGHIRAHLPARLEKSVKIHDINKDLINMKDHEIQEALSKEQLIPKRRHTTEPGLEARP